MTTFTFEIDGFSFLMTKFSTGVELLAERNSDSKKFSIFVTDEMAAQFSPSLFPDIDALFEGDNKRIRRYS